MFVNGIKFLLIVSWHIDFVTAQYVPSKKYSEYIKPIGMVCNMYAKRGFVVTAILVNPEFKHLETFLNISGESIGYIVQNSNLVKPSINIATKNEHVKGSRKKDPYHQGRCLVDASYHSDVSEDSLNASHSPDWCRPFLAQLYPNQV